MARKKKQTTKKNRKPSVRGEGARRAVAIKGHTRSPRGPDRGKKPVRVKPYKRRKPRRR